jgi:quercetin dioxygenase-like cupin family protein
MDATNTESSGQPRPIGDFRTIPTRPGSRFRELIGPGDGEHALFLIELIMEPGAEVPLHHHIVTESVIVLEGTLTVRAGNQHVAVEAGHSLLIPTATHHALANRTGAPCRLLVTAPWDHASFYAKATTYLEGIPRTS